MKYWKHTSVGVPGSWNIESIPLWESPDHEILKAYLCGSPRIGGERRERSKLEGMLGKDLKSVIFSICFHLFFKNFFLKIIFAIFMYYVYSDKSLFKKWTDIEELKYRWIWALSINFYCNSMYLSLYNLLFIYSFITSIPETFHEARNYLFITYKLLIPLNYWFGG